MKKALFILLLGSCSALAHQNDPVQQAVNFNKWYVNQISKDAFPITDSREIDKFVTASTMKNCVMLRILTTLMMTFMTRIFF